MLAALILAQQVDLRLSEIELPVTDCPAEIVLGVQKRPLATLELRIDNYRRLWDTSGRAPVNYENTRVGTTTWKVSEGLLGSKSCHVIDVVGTRTQLLMKARFEYQLRHRASRLWYVSTDGRLLAEAYRLDTPGGVWTMEAEYGDETFTVKLSSPDRGRRTMGPITPGFDLKELTEAPFKPMFGVGGEVKLKEKKFLMLDPFTGGPVSYTARLTDPFDGEYLERKWKGQKFEIKGGPEKQVAFVANQAQLLRVELEKYKFMELESIPN